MAIKGLERQLDGEQRLLHLALEGARRQDRVSPQSDVRDALAGSMMVDLSYLRTNRQRILSSGEPVVALPSGIAIDLTPPRPSFTNRLVATVRRLING